MLAITLAPACSTMPAAELPPHVDHHVAVDFVVPPNGRLALPASSAALSVQELQLDPPPLGERFRDAVRWFVYEPGTRVTVRGRLRTFGAGGAPPASPEQLFAGAARIRDLRDLQRP